MLFISLLPTIFGLILAGLLLSFLKLLFRNFISPTFFSKRKQVNFFGNWVVITGATDGIGKAFAEILAKDGYNLVLISRTEEKLHIVKKELLEKFNIDILVITADFTKVDIYDSIGEKIKNLAIGMLINNVGMSYSFPSFLYEENISNKFAIDILNCNCLSAVVMTKTVLNAGMLKKGGFILNISSAFSLVPSPFLSIYGASKSFVNAFSFNMQSELKYSKVTIQNVEPLVVATKMSRVKTGFMTPTAKYFANSVLNRLGTCKSTNGCFIHEVQAWIISLIPTFIIEKVLHSSLAATRIRALRKMEKKQ